MLVNRTKGDLIGCKIGLKLKPMILRNKTSIIGDEIDRLPAESPIFHH